MSGFAARARIEKTLREFGEGDAELRPQAAFQAAVILRAAENIADESAEGRAVIHQLHHAGGDGVAKEIAAKNFAGDACGKFEIGGNFRAEAFGISFGLSGHESFGEEVAGTHGVEKTFTGDGIDARGGVARQGPIFADDAAATKSVELRRGQNMAVKTRAIERNIFVGDETIEMAAQNLAGIIFHLAANAYGHVIGARERPDVAFEFLEELDLDHLFLLRNEIAESHFEIGGLERGGLRKKAIARAAGKDNEVGGLLFAADVQMDVAIIGADLGDARADGLAAGRAGAIEEKLIENGAGINDDGMAQLEARAKTAAGNQFGGANDFFRLRAVEKERIRFDGFVCEASATRLFPGKMLVVEGDLEAGRR